MKTMNDLSSQYRKHLGEIEEALEMAVDSQVAFIKDIGNYALAGPGKRLRPLFFVLSCELCNYQEVDIYRFSTIFEYIHTASLLHDDVLDNAEIRRNKPSVNDLRGNNAAVLGGDFLYSKASSLSVDSGNFRFMKKITDMTIQMTEGQVLELIHTNDWNVGKDEYLEIITAKTAALISAACACGAIISGADMEKVRALENFGRNMGIAFQLMDDLLDYTSSVDVIGKPVCKDLREGKITLPLIYTLTKLEKSERERFRSMFKDREIPEEDYADLIDMVRSKGALDEVRDEAEYYINEAEGCLSQFCDSPVKRHLLELNRFIIEREY